MKRYFPGCIALLLFVCAQAVAAAPATGRANPIRILTLDWTSQVVLSHIAGRLLQGALRSSILPRTKIDIGGQNAINAGVGYLGIFVAAVIAILAHNVDVGSAQEVPGITGRLYSQFAVTISVAVVISSINALTLSPALSAALLKPPGESKSAFEKFFDAFNRNFEMMANLHAR